MKQTNKEQKKRELPKGICPSCWGKGYYTQMYGIRAKPDFIGDPDLSEGSSIHKKECPTCNGTGKEMQNKEQHLANGDSIYRKGDTVTKITYTKNAESFEIFKVSYGYKKLNIDEKREVLNALKIWLDSELSIILKKENETNK